MVAENLSKEVGAILQVRNPLVEGSKNSVPSSVCGSKDSQPWGIGDSSYNIRKPVQDIQGRRELRIALQHLNDGDPGSKARNY